MPNDTNILPTPSEMVAHLNRYVHGQPRAKQDMAVAVYNHYLSQAYRQEHGADLGRHHILLIGPTGVGKTYLVRTLANFLGVPVAFATATSLVETGYVGNSVESMIATLIERAGGDVAMAEKGIVFIDEIDKIKKMTTGGARDVSGEGVQNALLTLLDGRISKGSDSREHTAVDTSKLLFVCTGAFVGLDEIVSQRVGTGGRPQIGFIARKEEVVSEFPDQPVYEALVQSQTKDLVNFGMIPEFIGRFATITVLHELSKDDLRAIMGVKTERSPLELQQKLAAVHGIDLTMSDGALEMIAGQAKKLGSGARGLHRLIGQALDQVDYRWPELAADGVTGVTISERTVTDGEEPVFSREENELKREDWELREVSLRGLPRSPQDGSAELVQNAWEKTGSVSRTLPPGITDVRGMTDRNVKSLIEEKRKLIGWSETSVSARKWWETFESESSHRPALVLRLIEELLIREATIQEFFLSYVYSNTDNIQANLHYLDYKRLKKIEDDKDEEKDQSEFGDDEDDDGTTEEEAILELDRLLKELESGGSNDEKPDDDKGEENLKGDKKGSDDLPF